VAAVRKAYEHFPSISSPAKTFVVNLHGALILTAVALRVGMKIGVHVLLTGKRALPNSCVSIQNSRNTAESIWKNLRTFWGLPSPPDDWHEGDTEPAP
jgi:hypothetical protein